MAARGFGPDGSCGTAGWLDGLLAKSHTLLDWPSKVRMPPVCWSSTKGLSLTARVPKEIYRQLWQLSLDS